MSKNTIQGKISWAKTQLDNAMRDFLASNLRKDRDRVLKLQAKVDTYREVLELINE